MGENAPSGEGRAARQALHQAALVGKVRFLVIPVVSGPRVLGQTHEACLDTDRAALRRPVGREERSRWAAHSRGTFRGGGSPIRRELCKGGDDGPGYRRTPWVLHAAVLKARRG